jgi:competence protein ComEA
MKKILFFMALSVSFLFSATALNLQTASKTQLMCVKGIGAKKADAIIKYRKANKLKSADDLLKIKGFGKGVISAVKKGEKTAKCSKKSKKTPAKRKDLKKSIKKVDNKKSEEKNSSDKK